MNAYIYVSISLHQIPSKLDLIAIWDLVDMDPRLQIQNLVNCALDQLSSQPQFYNNQKHFIQYC